MLHGDRFGIVDCNKLHADCFDDHQLAQDVYGVDKPRSIGRSHMVVHLGVTRGLINNGMEYGRVRGLIQVMIIIEISHELNPF